MSCSPNPSRTTTGRCATANSRDSSKCSRKGSDKILGAAIVGPRAGELLAELVLAKKHKLGLSKLSTPIHVYPTLAEANRALGDAYLLRRLRPGLRRGLSALFAWRRR